MLRGTPCTLICEDDFQIVMLRGTPCTRICEAFSLWATFNEPPDIIEVVELHLCGSTMSDNSLNLYPELRALQTKMCASFKTKIKLFLPITLFKQTRNKRFAFLNCISLGLQKISELVR